MKEGSSGQAQRYGDGKAHKNEVNAASNEAGQTDQNDLNVDLERKGVNGRNVSTFGGVTGCSFVPCLQVCLTERKFL